MLKKLTTTVLLSCMSLTANATLIDHDTYTTDTSTSLEWLDITPTLGLSRNQVDSTFTTQGWRYATTTDLLSLTSPFEELIYLMSNGSLSSTLGLFEHGINNAFRNFRRIATIQPTEISIDGSYASDDFASIELGSFLVRDEIQREVTEASSAALLGLGLFGLCLIRRRAITV